MMAPASRLVSICIAIILFAFVGACSRNLSNKRVSVLSEADYLPISQSFQKLAITRDISVSDAVALANDDVTECSREFLATVRLANSDVVSGVAISQDHNLIILWKSPAVSYFRLFSTPGRVYGILRSPRRGCKFWVRQVVWSSVRTPQIESVGFVSQGKYFVCAGVDGFAIYCSKTGELVADYHVYLPRPIAMSEETIDGQMAISFISASEKSKWYKIDLDSR